MTQTTRAVLCQLDLTNTQNARLAAAEGSGLLSAQEHFQHKSVQGQRVNAINSRYLEERRL
jgi:hypothetical protein